MNILIVSQYFYPEPFIINDIAVRLVEAGNRVTVYTGKPNYPEGKIYEGYSKQKISNENMNGIDIFRVPLRPRKKGSLNLIINYLSFVYNGIRYAKTFMKKKKNFDIIFMVQLSPITSMIPAIYLKKKLRLPMVTWVQDIWPESVSATGLITNRVLLYPLKILSNYLYNRSDLLLAQSKSFESLLLTRAKKSVRYYPNSYDSDRINNEPFIKNDILEKIKNKFIIMFAGNIGTAQDVETIVEAGKKLKDNPEIIIAFVGNGSMVAYINNKIQEHNLSNIILVGRVESKMMNSIYSYADVLLMTLKNETIFSMTVPSKLQSYLSTSKPIISAVPGEGNKIVLAANAGISVDPSDSDAIQKAIEQLFSMAKAELKKLGNNGKKYFDKHYNLRKNVTLLADIFEDFLKR